MKKRSRQHRKKLRDAQLKYWNEEEYRNDTIEAIREGVNEYWESKPNYEYVLGKRIRQKVNGERDAEGYRDYQKEYQRIWREQHPHWYAWRRQKAEGKTKLPYRVWLSWYKRNKK